MLRNKATGATASGMAISTKQSQSGHVNGWTPQPLRVPEVHHVVKRAQGGSDFDLDRLVALCRPCHAQTDAPYARGRLVVTPLGAGRFACAVVHRTSKWALQNQAPRVVSPRSMRGPEEAEEGGLIDGILQPARPPAAPDR